MFPNKEKSIISIGKKRTFATHTNREVFMIYSLCEGKHSLDDCKLFSKKVLQERRKFII